MKKVYLISLVSSFALAAICLGVSGSIIAKWSEEDHKQWVKMVFPNSNWAYRISSSNTEVGTSSDSKPFKVDTKDLQTVRFVVPQGNLHIKAGTEGLMTAQDLEEDCELLITQDGPDLTVKLANKSDHKEGCSGSLNAQIPGQLDVRLTVGQGDVSIEKMTGEIRFEIGSGNALITEAKGEVRGEVGVGEVSVVGNSPKMRIQMGSGNMQLKLSEKISEGSWKVDAGMGTISIELPPGQIAEEKFKTGMGNKSYSNTENRKSSFEIRAQTGVGDISSKIK